MESPVRLAGCREGVPGILHLPERFGESRPRRGLLTVHAEGGNKAGHKRSFVELGRHLEARGIAVLRFDLLDEGEAEELSEDPYKTWRGLRPAADFFWESHSLDQLVLLGDCFGGLLAAHYARLDDRVAHVVAWNLGQMKWTDQQLRGYAGTKDLSAHAAAEYRHKVFSKDTWLKLLTFRLRAGPLAQKLIARPARALVGRGLSLIRPWLRRARPQAAERPREGGRRISARVLHASATPRDEQVIAIARHAFADAGLEAEHLRIPGIPFSREWKRAAFSLVEEAVCGCEPHEHSRA
jgi:pimeloyl-ACP methyl ester carboxylesterase